MRIGNSGGISVYDRSDRVTVKDSEFSNNENDVGFHMSSFGLATRNVSRGTRNEAYCSYEQAGGPGATHDNVFVGNSATDAWAGIAFQRSSHNVARDNRIENCEWGISVYAQGETGDYSHGNVIDRNTIVGGAKSTVWALLVERPSHDNVFTGNTVTGWPGVPVRIDTDGLQFNGNSVTGCGDGASVKGSRLTLMDNLFSGSAGQGILLGVCRCNC